jgi:Lysylphosphatidylglycerol synthase TM region
MRRRLRTWAPWVVAALVLVYVFSDVSARTLADALGRVSPWRFGLVLLWLNAGALLADSLTIWLALAATARADRDRGAVAGQVSESAPSAGPSADRAAPGPGRETAAPRYRDILLVRCASALLSLLNYGAGQGGVVYFLRRSHGISLEAGAGAILLASAGWLAVLALAAGLGLLAGAVPDRPELRAVAWAALAALPAYVLLAALRPRFLVRQKLLRYLLAVPPAALVRVLGARVLHLGVLVSGHWLAMRLFDIAVPPAAALLRLPALFLVGAVPISPAGLGTTQAAAMTLFGDYAAAPGEAARQATVLAYSLSCHVISVVLLLLIGLVCWRRLGRTRAAASSPTPDHGSA